MDGTRLRQIFERLDEALEGETILDLHGGAAVLSLGSSERTTIDIDVLPSSRFDERVLRQACSRIGLKFEPPDKDYVEEEYLEVIPEEMLVLPRPSEDLPYNTVYRGTRLTIRTPPAADLVVGKLKRLEPEDLTDIGFLIRAFDLDAEDLRESFDRLPARLSHDPVVVDNLRYVLEDHQLG